MEKRSSYIKDVGITILFGIAISFLGYLFNIYLARHLSQDDFSIYNATIGLIYLVQVPAITIQAYITQKVAQNTGFNLSSFKRKSILTFAGIGLFLSLLIIILSPILSSSLNIPVTSVYTISFVLFASLISPVAKGLLFGMQKILTVNIVMFLETVLKFGLGMVALWIVQDVNIAIIANGLPLLLSGLILLPFISFNGTESKEIAIDFKHLSRVFFAFFLINTPFTIDLLLINHEVRAEYGALSLLGKIVFFACIMIANTMFSHISKEGKKEGLTILNRSILLSLVIGFGISFIYFLFGRELVEVVFKGGYSSIYPYAWIYGIGMSLYAVSYLITNYLIIIERKWLVLSLILPLVLQIVLYTIYNGSLVDAIRNQIVVYGGLLVVVWHLLFRTITK